MSHRFVHIGDLHLGPKPRNEDRLAALDQIIGEQEATDVSAWLIPGDLNDGLMRIGDRNALKERMKRMAAVAPVVACYGNHDLPGDLDIFADLGTRWPIYVVVRPTVLRVPLARGGTAAIFVLPYPSRVGLVAAGTPSDQIVEAARQALDLIFISAAAQLAEAKAAGLVPLMIGHINVGGSISSSGQPNIGKEIELDPALIARLDVGYVGLNHIHKAQTVGGAHYAGSCCRLDWGEIEEKRYLTIDCGKGDEMREGATDADGWIYAVTSHPLDVAPMYHVEGRLTRERFDWQFDGDSLMLLSPPDSGRPPTIDCAGCEVRVRYTFNASEKTALDEAIVRAPFVGAKRLVLEPIALHARASRAPEVAAAQTLEEKVAAFLRVDGTDWTPSLDQKYAALHQAEDEASFLADLERTLSTSAPAPAPQEVCQ